MSLTGALSSAISALIGAEPGAVDGQRQHRQFRHGRLQDHVRDVRGHGDGVELTARSYTSGGVAVSGARQHHPAGAAGARPPTLPTSRSRAPAFSSWTAPPPAAPRSIPATAPSRRTTHGILAERRLLSAGLAHRRRRQHRRRRRIRSKLTTINTADRLQQRQRHDQDLDRGEPAGRRGRRRHLQQLDDGVRFARYAEHGPDHLDENRQQQPGPRRSAMRSRHRIRL